MLNILILKDDVENKPYHIIGVDLAMPNVKDSIAKLYWRKNENNKLELERIIYT